MMICPNDELSDEESSSFELDESEVEEGFDPFSGIVLDNVPIDNDKASAEQSNDLNSFALNKLNLKLAQIANLDFDDIKAIKTKEELFYDIKLDLTYYNLFTKRDIGFNSALGFDSTVRKKFRSFVLRKRAYLEEDLNYAYVDSLMSDKSNHLTMLANSRVILFWRNIQLEVDDQKRFITLGFCLLIGVLTESELLFEIRKSLIDVTVNVKVTFVENRYVFIGIEAPPRVT
jgi:hypothetical protein